jgi:transcriptional regulator with XRE-family HTH domain
LLQVAEYENFVRKRITQLRHRLHVSEHKMSLDLGKSGSYMRSISIGKAMPSMHEFLRICEYLGVTPQEFFTGAGDETDRINIFNRLQDLDDGDIQKLQTFLGWMQANSTDMNPETGTDRYVDRDWINPMAYF